MRKTSNKKAVNFYRTPIFYGGILIVGIFAVAFGAFFLFPQTPPKEPVMIELSPSKTPIKANSAIFGDNLPPTNRHLELIGDNLAKANVNLEKQRPDIAFLFLEEARNELFALNPHEINNRQAIIITKIEQIEADLKHSRLSESHQKISELCNELDDDFQ